jgi:hypothetical protein
MQIHMGWIQSAAGAALQQTQPTKDYFFELKRLTKDRAPLSG